MKTPVIAVTLKQAREWYNSDNATLKELALRAFKLTDILTRKMTFEEARKVLSMDEHEISSQLELLEAIQAAAKEAINDFKERTIKRAYAVLNDK